MKRVWAEINLDNLKNNLALIRKISGNREVMGIIKADAYGHGSVQIAKEMEANGVTFFGVACIDEAEELIKSGIKGTILILGCTPLEDWKRAVELGVRLTLCSMEEVNFIKSRGLYPSIHIKIDTGMGRIGFDYKKAVEVVKYIIENRFAKVEGIFTHLSSSDDSPEYTEMQIERFEKIIAEFPNIPYKHIANSGGVMNIPDKKHLYNLLRPGIIMYGVVPFVHSEKEKFKPVMILKSRVVFVKTLDEDTFISYGRTHFSKAGTKIATIPAGYADGITRKLSNCGEVEIKGIRCPIIGKVCMDQMMVEIPDTSDISEGDEVTIFGGMVSVEEIAEIADTIPYEILTCINKRVLRMYIKNGQVNEVKSLLGVERRNNS